MPKKKPHEVTGAIVEMLSGFSGEERVRIVQAAMTLLGEAPVLASVPKGSSAEGASELGELPPKAKLWAKQNGITLEQLEQIFHMAGDSVEIIAPGLPGKSSGEKSRNAYLLAGIAALLSTGDATFTDDTARIHCTKAGCYDKSNHSRFIKAMGNEFAGNKSKGWALTAPGLKNGATLIKELATLNA